MLQCFHAVDMAIKLRIASVRDGQFVAETLREH